MSSENLNSLCRYFLENLDFFLMGRGFLILAHYLSFCTVLVSMSSCAFCVAIGAELSRAVSFLCRLLPFLLICVVLC